MLLELITSPKPFCLVLMPFDKEFNDTYELGIKAACQLAGAYCERVDEQHFHGSILERIRNQIAKADFVVADMTAQNPNVFYEVGYAHALNKRTLLLTRASDDIPFDLSQFQHIVYEGRITTLRDKLRDKIEWCINNPPETGNRNTVDIDIYSGRNSLTSVTPAFPGGAVVNLLLHNASSRTLEKGSFSLCVVSAEEVVWRQPTCHTMLMPDGRIMTTLLDLGKLFPGQFAPFDLVTRSPPFDQQATLRVFTASGTRDFSISITSARNLQQDLSR